MSRRYPNTPNLLTKQAKHHNSVAKARSRRRGTPSGKRARGVQRNEQLPFAPPEDWHEPTGKRNGYRIVVQPPGQGYRHVVTAEEVRDRLAELPKSFVHDLEVIQLSRMTRKKKSFPCYGMQWGSALYLYPLEDSLIEYFYSPPPANLVAETRMYGATWQREEPGPWKLVWTGATIKDYYLNNILIHELGHLLDERNGGYIDRERYAEWFAIEYGYRRSRQQNMPHATTQQREIKRRHHSA